METVLLVLIGIAVGDYLLFRRRRRARLRRDRFPSYEDSGGE